MGTVYDSLAHKPLAAAVVDLAPAPNTAGTAAGTTSDSLGHYEFDGVAQGTYILGFFHPRLDSLGIDAPIQQVSVGSAARARVDLAVPSAKRIRDAVCHASSNADSSGMLVGHVQSAATGGMVEGATVTAQWALLWLANGHLTRTVPTARATTSSSGWFAFCSLPSTAPVSVQVANGGDSSGVIAVDVPAEGVTMRTFYIANVKTVTLASPDTSTVPDSLPAPEERVYRGPGLLKGVVRNGVNNDPLPGVRLTVQGTGLTAASNAKGEFSLDQLPLGTQMLLARKVGYMPGEAAVDILPDAPGHAELVMPTIESVMDTVKVFADRVYDTDRNGFRSRQKLGIGHYFDPDQVARIAPFETTDLLRRVPSVRISYSGLDHTVLMRGVWGDCSPEVYVDGTYMTGMLAGELDTMVLPEAVAGMEVYTSPMEAPPQFQMGRNACGVIVVWTRPIPRRRP
jgi:hypothetical protein